MRRTDRTKLADELLARHHVAGPPVPVEEMAIAEGIAVVRSVGDWNESGFLLRDNVNTIIGINSRHSRKRQRFTIAHELGHWRLHKGKLIVDQSVMIHKRDNVSSQATNIQEIEANQFAADLLMPREFIGRAFDNLRHGSRDELVAALAADFDVSAEAMGFRLTNLGMLSVY